MYYTIYKDFFEFPVLILSDYNVEEVSLWEREWGVREDYHADTRSILVALGSSSTGEMIDDPTIIFVSETVDLGRQTHRVLKFEDFDYCLFEGPIQLGKEQTLQINIDSHLFVGCYRVNLKIWGNKNKDKRKDLYIEIETTTN